MSAKRELTKKETEKEQEKMGDRKSEAANNDMLTSMKAGFDNVHSEALGPITRKTEKK